MGARGDRAGVEAGAAQDLSGSLRRLSGSLSGSLREAGADPTPPPESALKGAQWLPTRAVPGWREARMGARGAGPSAAAQKRAEARRDAQTRAGAEADT